MGIRIIRKWERTGARRRSRVGLVLASGAVSGGAFKIGGLIALNCYLKNRKVTDFDTFVGMSAGALLATPIAQGVPPEELLKSMHGRSRLISRFGMGDFYWPNWREGVGKASKLVHDALAFNPTVTRTLLDYVRHNHRAFSRSLTTYLRAPDVENLEQMLRPLIRAVMKATDLPHPLTYVPGGLFDNSRIERYLRRNLERNRMPNSFRLLRRARGRDLYVGATALDTAEEVVFGPDERNDVTISEAVQASTAIPLFYRPARIHGEDFLDAAVRKTANITFAASRGADLIICYNPFRPFHYSETQQILPRIHRLGDMGLLTIINQAVRTMLHSRLELGLEALSRDPSFKGDIILIEPMESDADFFSINPIAFWRRAESAQHGFATAKSYFERNHRALSEVLGLHGIDVDLRALRRSGERLAEARFDDRAILNLLEQPSIPRRLRVLA